MVFVRCKLVHVNGCVCTRTYFMYLRTGLCLCFVLLLFGACAYDWSVCTAFHAALAQRKASRRFSCAFTCRLALLVARPGVQPLADVLPEHVLLGLPVQWSFGWYLRVRDGGAKIPNTCTLPSSSTTRRVRCTFPLQSKMSTTQACESGCKHQYFHVFQKAAHCKRKIKFFKKNTDGKAFG